ncbi:hypothetical protein [Terasakiella sp. SH-1]|uniref:hypothetical protein n=1 Tax=Terasakiella sp. SH-1 TaxID=2560057 RepID=UPI0010749011|nr:hypothetical protein [Terasakiella sp. SH-1]
MGSEELLLEAGKSNELSAVLHTMAECEIDGEMKFSPMVCREIGKLIVCRNYASALLELSHLIVAASDLSIETGRYEFFFWDSGPAQSSHFQHYCCQAEAENTCEQVSLSPKGLTISYPDGEFSIQYSRMPVLSALFEFLLTALGYSDIDEILQDLLCQAPPTKKAVSDAANNLSRLLYAYLRTHLPPAQSQRKFRKILAYCENDVENIDDTMILNFWQEASLNPEKGVDFKTFDSVLLTFIRVIQAIESARDLSALHNAGAIGHDHEAGEINPDLLSQTIDSVQETLSPLLQLTSSPLNQVKFLNKQEQADLEGLLSAGTLALRLPLSILRSDIFSGSQARLTQALRRHVGTSELQNLIDEGPDETYQDRQMTYQSLRQHLERSVYASLHALATARHKDAVNVMLKLEPDIDFSSLAQHLIDEKEKDTNVVTLHTNAITDRFMSILHDPQAVGPKVAEMMSTSEIAYKKLSRKGFKEDVHEHPELCIAFAQGADLLLDIARDIDAFLERLDCMALAGGGWQSQFSYDRTLFNGQFSKIYGGMS